MQRTSGATADKSVICRKQIARQREQSLRL